MSVQTFNDRALLDVLSLLAARRESGRLKLTNGSTRGAFFLKKGKLVAAHMGALSGFQAVNLAVSVGRVSLSFDSSIPPTLSDFAGSAEREVLQQRFGIETAAPEIKGESKIGDESLPINSEPAQVSAQPTLVDQLRRTKAKPARPLATRSTSEALESKLFSITPTSAPSEDESGMGWTAIKSSVLSLSQRLTNTSPRQRLVALIGFVVGVLIIPAIVGLAPYLTNSSEAKPREVFTAESTGGAPAVAPVVEPSRENPTKAINERTPVTRQSPADISDHPDPAPAMNSEKAKTAKEPPAESASTSLVKGMEIEPPKPLTETIAVVVEVNEGHVTEAYIKAPRPGLGAYEATALRMARQRRFPKGTNGKETINLMVTREP